MRRRTCVMNGVCGSTALLCPDKREEVHAKAVLGDRMREMKHFAGRLVSTQFPCRGGDTREGFDAIFEEVNQLREKAQKAAQAPNLCDQCIRVDL